MGLIYPFIAGKTSVYKILHEIIRVKSGEFGHQANSDTHLQCKSR